MARRTSNSRTLCLALCIVMGSIAAPSSATESRWRIDDKDLVPEALSSAGWRLLFRADRALTYVWGGAHERGKRFPNPYEKENGAVVVLRPASTPLREWHWEEVDFAADFELAFGFPAPPVRYVAVSADSEDVGGSSMAVVADLRFQGDPS